MTSYKATRNLLMDIPSLDKTIFLIDRKDLDTQTTMAFQAYANNDLIDVNETDNVNDLKKKLKSEDRQVIVTTIQKLQRLITKRLQEGTPEYNKIKNLRIAFVVDECHRAVTPGTKRELERFFGKSLWYGFTGTPRFSENPYPKMGDLPRTTDELYGERLHRYTIQNAIHDNAVLGFQVEHNGPKTMQKSLDDYNNMFGTKFDLAQIQSYNGNLNKRLARKDPKFKRRHEQLDLVIVVDRLLTGFDAPCMSTMFIDRQPMGPHDLIQAFSRTNRIFDKNKTYGQIVTFQAPKLFKESVDNAVKLYSAGGTNDSILAEWDEVEKAFRTALKALRIAAGAPTAIPGMSLAEKKVFAKIFQTFDRLFAQLKSFSKYSDKLLEEYDITEEEYEDYVAHYKNVIEEIKREKEEGNDGGEDEEETSDLDSEYELMAYSNTKIDYEYIINLIQNIVSPGEDEEDISPEERQKQIDEVKQYIAELRNGNPKMADIMSNLVSEIEVDADRYKGHSILNIVETTKQKYIENRISDFCEKWYAEPDDVMYAAMHYRNDEIPNEGVIKATIDYTCYKANAEKAVPKFKYYKMCMDELKEVLDTEIKPLINPL